MGAIFHSRSLYFCQKDYFCTMTLIQLYQERAEDFKQRAEALQRRYEKFGFVRLASFIIAIIILILVYNFHPFAGIIATIFFLATFYRLVQWHQRLLHEKQIEEALALINQRELAFMQDDFQAFADGKEFIDPSHPNSIDMDIFGPYSFFQYANRTTTSMGKKRLAEYLTTVADKPEILARQEAIAELQNQLEWRQKFQAHGMTTEDAPEHITQLKKWLAQPDFILSNPKYKAALIFAPILSFIGLFVWIFYWPWYFSIWFFLAAFYMLRTTLDLVNQTHVQTTKAGKTLAYYAYLIEHLEDKHFQSDKLQSLSSALDTNAKKASDRLKRLSYIIHQLNLRYNAFVIILNIFTLWDLQWVLRLEKWKSAQRDDLPQWFSALAEFEALLSFATVYYNRPAWIFPEITEQALFDGTSLGHPLIAPKERVANDIQIPTAGHIKLVTGSNMAGKSTFLRTVGLNIVLAMAGAPVCAEKLRLPVLELYSSMRTQDALHESTSSFYAELKRLKIIIEAVEEKENVFFLMDEILKGTNSNDRHTGSKALITQLIKSKGSGIIATHDLELGAMAESANGAIENLCIEVAVENGKLIFDYKIKPGVSQSFNATLLMREMGIRV